MKRFVLATALAAGALFAASAVAAPLTYRIDPGHTQVLASWSHLGFSHPSAYFGGAQGTIVYDADDVSASSVEVTLPVSGLNSFVPKLDEYLRGDEYFNAAKYPEITFRSTAVEATGEKGMKVTGDLTMKGVTRPVVLDVTLNKAARQPMANREAVGFDATTTLKRSEFGIDKLVPSVSDEIKLHITTEAIVPKAGAGK